MGDQFTHSRHLIWIYNVHLVIGNNLMNLKVNSLDPDQMALFAHAIKAA
jgi:hypothetical protein